MNVRIQRFAWLLINVLLLILLGCGGGGGSSPAPAPVPISVSLSPAQATVTVSATQQFTPAVSGSSAGVSWSVNDVAGGNATVGRINASGLYTAPDVPPSPNTVVVKAASVADTSKSASATVSVVNPAPQPTGATTSSGTTIVAGSGDLTVTVQGSGFTVQSVVMASFTAATTSLVKLAAISSTASALNTSFVSSTELTAILPATLTSNGGTITLSVETPAPGGGTTAAGTLAIDNPVPAVSGVSPSSVIVGTGAFTLTVNGSKFVSGAVVYWNGNARTTAFASATELTASIPATDLSTATSAISIAVVNPTPGGGNSNSTSFAVNNPVPAISSLSSTTAPVGAPGFTLTVNGSNFVFGAKVQWNGSARTTTFVSATQVSADIPSSDLTNGGVVNVTVVNPTPGGGSSSATSFNVINPVPAISALSQTTANAGASAFTLTVTGSSFVPDSVVQWNGNARSTTFSSSTQVSAAIPASDLVTGSTASVTVVNSSPGGGTSNAATFTVNNPVPVMSSISPNAVIVGGSGFTLTVNGSGFVPGSIVKWGGADRTTTYVSSTQLTIAVAQADIAGTGTVSVTVFNPAPAGGTSAGATLAINNPVPVVSSVSPNSATAGGTTFTLTINGSNFVSGATVQWCNPTPSCSSLTPATVTSAQLTAAVPASYISTASSSITVAVVNPTPGGGTSTPGIGFTVNNPLPAISSLSATTAIVGDSPFSLTITGSGFVATSQVNWNSAPRTPVSYSSTQLTVNVTATDLASAAVVPITVTNPTPGGGTSSPAATFTIYAAPIITSLSPSSTTALGPAFLLTVNGSNFVSGAKLYFNLSEYNTNVAADGASLTATISSSDIQAPGTPQVKIVNVTAGGGVSNTVNFTVNSPLPTITSLVPSSHTAGSADFQLVINGTNFVTGAQVLWPGKAPVVATVSNSGQLSATIPASYLCLNGPCTSGGTVNVSVQNPNPGSQTSGTLPFTIMAPAALTSTFLLYPVNNGTSSVTQTNLSINNDYDCDATGTTSDYEGNQTSIQCGADKPDMVTLALNVQPWDTSTLTSVQLTADHPSLVRVFDDKDQALVLPVNIDPLSFDAGAIQYHAEGLPGGNPGDSVQLTLTVTQNGTPSNKAVTVVVGKQIGIKLTFDDGPDNNDLPGNQTYEVLNGLSSYLGGKVPATFFAQTNLPFHAAGDVGGPLVTSEENEGSATQIHTGNSWDSTCDNTCGTNVCHSNATCALVCSNEWACDHISHCVRVQYPGYQVTGINGTVTGTNALQSDLIQGEAQIKTLTTTASNPNGSTPTLVRPPYGGYPRGDPACTSTLWTTQVVPTYGSVTPNALTEQYWDVDSGDTSSTCASSPDPLGCLQNNLTTGIQSLIPAQTSVVLLLHDDVANGFAATYIQQLLKTVQKAVRYKGMNEVFGALGP